jgi:hypothetical protein
VARTKAGKRKSPFARAATGLSGKIARRRSRKGDARWTRYARDKDAQQARRRDARDQDQDRAPERPPEFLVLGELVDRDGNRKEHQGKQCVAPDSYRQFEQEREDIPETGISDRQRERHRDA